METDVSRKKSRIEELEERLATTEKDYDSYKVSFLPLVSMTILLVAYY